MCVKLRSWAERCAAGKALREKCPRRHTDQNEQDHDALERAVRQGKVKAVFEEAK